MSTETRIDSVTEASSDRLFGWQTIYGYFTQFWLWRFRLHIFWKPEPSVMFHDHAWSFISVPLISYVERVLDHDTGETRLQIVRAFRANSCPAEHTHKYMGRWSGEYADGVPTVKPGAVVTLAWRGPGARDWSYWKVGPSGVRQYPWRSYLTSLEARAKRLIGET